MDVDERIRHDAGLLAGDPEAAALLECLGKHGFDADLDIGSMVKICGASRRVRDRLVEKIGSLKAWVAELRMAEAGRLVRDTKVPILEIGRRVGYPVKKTFGRAFRKAHGMKPSDMRKQARLPRKAAPESAPVAVPADDAREIEGDERLTPRALAARLRRRMTLGLLDSRRAAELRLRLRRRHPGLDEAETRGRAEAGQAAPGQTGPVHQQVPIVLTPTNDYLEESSCAAVLGELIDGPEDELRFALLHGVRFGNVGSYLHLQRTCTRLIQWQPERALMLAELAVQMIEPHRELMGDEADDRQAQAWVFLGRVQEHLGDCGGAEQSLGFARAEVGGAEGLKPWVEIELRQVEGMVRKRQRRYDEAVRALDRAVELGRELEPTDPDRYQTVLQRLELASALGDVEAGLAFADELEKLLAVRDDHLTLWHGFVSFHRGKANAAAGRECCAENFLRQTIRDIAADPACDSDMRLGVLFTFALHELARIDYRSDRLDDCESMLRHALERYRWFQISVFEAASEAELAVVCALRGGWAEARQLASASAAFLDALPFHREAWNAARRLRALSGGGAASASELADLLSTLQSELDLVCWEITGSKAVPAARTRRAEK